MSLPVACFLFFAIHSWPGPSLGLLNTAEGRTDAGASINKVLKEADRALALPEDTDRKKGIAIVRRALDAVQKLMKSQDSAELAIRTDELRSLLTRLEAQERKTEKARRDRQKKKVAQAARIEKASPPPEPIATPPRDKNLPPVEEDFVPDEDAPLPEE